MIEVSPNPASDVININGNFSKAVLYATSGQVVFETTKNQISLTNVAGGIYYLQVTTDAGMVTRKVIIRK